MIPELPDSICYYAISNDLALTQTTSVDRGLQSKPWLVLRTYAGTYEYRINGVGATNKYFDFDFFQDELGPKTLLERNGWIMRLSDMLFAHNYYRDYNSFWISMVDPDGVVEKRGPFSSKDADGIVKAL